jgi:predicted AlkP superfamily pyrophosphatase or phosphodiesterase
MNILFAGGRMRLPARFTGRVFGLLALLLATCGAIYFQGASQVITVDHGPNDAAQQTKPYVILVSLDGFRYDYGQKYGAKNLLALAARGASAPQGMIPSYPSITFPNHYAIVTGLYPEHHGIVAMTFYDPLRKQHYSFRDPQTATDGTWYGGVPLWSLAEKQGMRTACFFWPGSEAEIAGARPTYYLKYDDNFPDEKRVDQVIDWLRLPDAQRPHFITLYYASVDHAGHQYGPDAPETKDAVHHVDEIVGRLEAEIAKLPLRVDVIVVADHGMENEEGDWINLDKYADLSEFETDGPLLYPKSEAAAEVAYEKLRGASDKFTVYRRSQMPKELHYDSNPRAGDPIVVPNGPYAIRAHVPPGDFGLRPPTKGVHGYDPYKMITMRAIFYAAGPDIRPGTTVAPFENVNIYPAIAKILGLSYAPIDGNLRELDILQPPKTEKSPMPPSNMQAVPH